MLSFGSYGAATAAGAAISAAANAASAVAAIRPEILNLPLLERVFMTMRRSMSAQDKQSVRCPALHVGLGSAGQRLPLPRPERQPRRPDDASASSQPSSGR